MSVVFPPYDAPGHPVGMTSLLDVTISQTRPPPQIGGVDRPRAGTYPCFPFYHFTTLGENISHLRSI